MDKLVPYDPTRDRPMLVDCLSARFASLPPSGVRRLTERFLGLVPAHGADASSGLVLGGGPPAFVFLTSAAPRCRVTAIVCDPGRQEELVGVLAQWLVPRYARVLVEAEAWWGALGLDARVSARAWSRAGFSEMAIDVFETRLPAARGRAVPAGYATRAWGKGDLGVAARLMADNPDTLGGRYPLSAQECGDVLGATQDRGHGATLWCGAVLAGFVRTTPVGDVAQLYVDRAHRDRGAGAHLLDMALARFDKSRLVRARVAMATGNARALALYASRGFVPRDRYACRLYSQAS